MKISIINYDSVSAERILKLLNKINISVKLITDEINICNSDIIIMPDCNDLLKANRKLQLFNLSNVIKIINKKIIGINNGMFLMCSNIIGCNSSGLGLFHSDVYKFNETQTHNFLFSDLNTTKEACVKLENLEGGVRFNSSYYILENDNTCISAKINRIPISILNKHNNYIG